MQLLWAGCLALLVLLPLPAHPAVVLPIEFQPLGPGQGESLLYNLYANTSLYGEASGRVPPPPAATAILPSWAAAAPHLYMVAACG